MRDRTVELICPTCEGKGFQTTADPAKPRASCLRCQGLGYTNHLTVGEISMIRDWLEVKHTGMNWMFSASPKMTDLKQVFKMLGIEIRG